MSYGRRFTPNMASQSSPAPDFSQASPSSFSESKQSFPEKTTVQKPVPSFTKQNFVSHTRATLNNAKVLTCLLQGIFDRKEIPTPELIQDLNFRHKKLVEAIQKKAYPNDDHPSVRAQIARASAPLVAYLYEQDPRFDQDYAVDLFLTQLSSQEVYQEQRYEELPESVGTRLSEAKNMAILMPVINRCERLGKFSACIWGDFTQFQAINHLKQGLQFISESVVTGLGLSIKSKDGLIAYKSVFGTAATLVKNSLISIGEQTVADMKGRSPQDLKGIVENCLKEANGHLLNKALQECNDMVCAIYFEPEANNQEKSYGHAQGF